MSKCWKRASPPSAEFHYLHHEPDGAPYADRGRDGRRASSPRRAKTGIGLTLLPVFYAHGGFGGAPPKPEQRRFMSTTSTASRGCSRPAKAGRRAVRTRRSASRRTACVRQRRTSLPASSRSPASGRSTSTPPSRSRKSRIASPALGARPVRWLLDHAGVDRALVSRPRDAYGRARNARSRGVAARSPASARSPKPISATGCSTRAT